MSKQPEKQKTKQEQRRARREEQQRLKAEQMRSAQRKRLLTIGVLVLLAIAVIGTAFFVVSKRSTLAQTPTPTADVLLSGSGSSPAYPPVNNISCNSNEQFTYHVHAHLSLYIKGQPVPIPANIGIASDRSCFYWLHTHDFTGVIHIEAPKSDTYTLGTFFQLWKQRFPQLQYPSQLDQTVGWKVYINGKSYQGDWHKVALTSHMLITMADQSSKVTPDTVFNWGPNGSQ